MFNRALKVSMIKNDKKTESKPSLNDSHFEGRVAVIGYYLEKSVKTVAKAALAYVVLDTVRQVLVAEATK